MLAGKQWFSTLDLASGYWQVSLSQDARAKTAFATHSGLFQFRVMPFGLCNAPATFERLMDRVLQGLRWSRCLVYLDDIISFGGTFGAALSNLTLIFERLRLYGLQLKSSKCHLFRESVPFLGHIVGLRSDDTVLLNARCWRWWPCAYSLDLICVEHALLSGRITSRWCGCIVLRTRRVCCPDGCILCNNSSSPLYTGRERTMEMLMDFHALHRRRVGSAHARTARRPL